MAAPTTEIFTYDLMATLRNNPVKRKIVEKAVEEVTRLEEKVRQGKADRTEQTSALAKLIPVCGFNFGMLVPHIFPRYPRESPLSLIQRPFMFAMMTLAANNILTLRSGRQIGKCADGDTTVSTKDHGEMTLRQLYEMGSRTN